MQAEVNLRTVKWAQCDKTRLIKLTGIFAKLKCSEFYA